MDKYPRGKLNADDAGAMEIAVGVQDKTVIIKFSEATTWIGFDADGAIQLAETLIKRARECGSTKPLQINF